MHTAVKSSKRNITAKPTAATPAETTPDKKKNAYTTADTTTKTKKEY